ncbi:hypothetical protein B0H14DRAFT_3128672 [Mycena olivaceomarginata]|nr:hypothetical protein B0H14DRAFT_3128672 [Mycena olivaceomarginata]
MQPDVYLEFPCFLDDLVDWMTIRRAKQTDRSGNAMTLVRTTTDIFCGAGVYTISELWHMAGLLPNLTEAEVFNSASRTARLCSAFYHFAKEAHTTLWPLVKRCLVGYMICVSEEDRLLYGNRLHVYGKDRSQTTNRFHDLLSELKAVCDAPIGWLCAPQLKFPGKECSIPEWSCMEAPKIIPQMSDQYFGGCPPRSGI